MKKCFAFFLCSMMSATAFANQLTAIDVSKDVSDSLIKCRKAVVSDNVACPVVEKFSYPEGLLINQVKALILDELKYTPVPADFLGARSPILDRLKSYQGLLTRDPNAGDAKNYVTANKTLLEKLAFLSQLPGSVVYKDEYYEWAPSVKAAAAIVVNCLSHTVDIFVLGDADG